MNTHELVGKILSALPIEGSHTLLLYGPPATGKSYAAETIGVREGTKVYSVTLTLDTPASELRGHWVNGPQGFEWHDGIASLAMRQGARLCLHEINEAGPDLMGLLYMLLDSQETARLTLPNGETLKPARGYHVVATSNIESPMELIEPIRSRLCASVLVDEVSDAALATLPNCLRDIARQTCSLRDPERRIDLRAWRAYAALAAKIGSDPAAQAVFGPRAGGVEDALKLAKLAE